MAAVNQVSVSALFRNHIVTLTSRRLFVQELKKAVMCDRPPQSDSTFKVPSQQCPPGGVYADGRNQNSAQMRGRGRGSLRGRGNWDNSNNQEGGGNYNQRRNNQREGNSGHDAPSVGNRSERRDRSNSKNRHRSNSSGREGGRSQWGGNERKSGERQYGHGYTQERSTGQEFNQPQQSDKQWGNFQSQQRRRGQGQNRQYAAYDGNYYSESSYNYSQQGGHYRRNRDSQDEGGWDRRGGQHNHAGYSNDWQSSGRNYYGGDDWDVFLSKTLSSILRHNAERFGFKLMKGGFLYVDEILKNVHKLHGYTLADVKRIVESNDKKRFALEDENGRFKIRANQGHSLEVEALELQPVTSADEAPVVIHGTYFSSWEVIKKTGLSRMNRNHIHFAAGEPGENGVISGMRKTCEVMIYIDMEKALKDGLKFYRSANNVILCEGDEKGMIYPCYFQGVLDRIKKHRLSFDDKIGPSNAEEKPESKKRKKKSKGKNQEKDDVEQPEERTEEPERKGLEDGATTDDSSLPAAKKQHLSDANPDDVTIAAEVGAPTDDSSQQTARKQQVSDAKPDAVTVAAIDESAQKASEIQHVSLPQPDDAAKDGSAKDDSSQPATKKQQESDAKPDAVTVAAIDESAQKASETQHVSLPQPDDAEKDGAAKDDSLQPAAKKQQVSHAKPDGFTGAAKEGTTKNDSSLQAAKKKHVSDAKPNGTPGVAKDGAKKDDSSLRASKKQQVPNTKPDGFTDAGSSMQWEDETEEETKSAKSKHWNKPTFVKAPADSVEIVDNLCSFPLTHIAVCCVGERLGTEDSKIRAIVISAQPDSYIYHLNDDNTSLVKEGKLEQLLMNNKINKVFHDISIVSNSLVAEFDILLDGPDIWDIMMMYNKITVAQMDLQELNFDEKMFKKWTKQNEEYGKNMAKRCDEKIAADLVERGKMIWDLFRLCHKKLDDNVTKKLTREISQAATRSNEAVLTEKIRRLKVEKKCESPPEATEWMFHQEQDLKQQTQAKWQTQGKHKKKKGKGKHK